MNDTYFFKDIASVFHFGKHKGKSLWNVLLEDESYIYWCIDNIPEFTISKDALIQIRALLPMFIVTSGFANHIGISKEFMDIDINNSWIDNKEESTFEQYGCSYAQQEMAYSDDDIDTIFDGDPLAYWNID